MSSSAPRGKKAQRAAERRAAAARAKKRKRTMYFGVLAVVLVGVVVALWPKPLPEVLASVETFPDLGQDHVDPATQNPEYNSDPATSGPHSANPAPCGVFRQPIPDLNQVHDLEHGAVAILYQPEIDPAVRDQLEDFARQVGTHILVSPRPGLSDPVVLVAWTRLLRLAELDMEAVQAFYDSFAQRGPEAGVPCPFAVDEGA
ncbi:MAG: DUF3105 domain-containing protein [Acidimicrobiia bacterium]